MNKFLSLSSKLLLVVALLAVTFAGIPAVSHADNLRDVGQPSQTAQKHSRIRSSPPAPCQGTTTWIMAATVMDPTQYPVDGAIRFWRWSALNPASGSL